MSAPDYEAVFTVDIIDAKVNNAVTANYSH